MSPTSYQAAPPRDMTRMQTSPKEVGCFRIGKWKDSGRCPECQVFLSHWEILISIDPKDTAPPCCRFPYSLTGPARPNGILENRDSGRQHPPESQSGGTSSPRRQNTTRYLPLRCASRISLVAASMCWNSDSFRLCWKGKEIIWSKKRSVLGTAASPKPRRL